jgi:hypothetical protein
MLWYVLRLKFLQTTWKLLVYDICGIISVCLGLLGVNGAGVSLINFLRRFI